MCKQEHNCEEEEDEDEVHSSLSNGYIFFFWFGLVGTFICPAIEWSKVVKQHACWHILFVDLSSSSLTELSVCVAVNW